MTFNEAKILNVKQLPNETEDNSVTKKVELEMDRSNNASADQGEEEEEKRATSS